MANELMYIPNDAIQIHHLSRLQKVIKTFEHSTLYINQSLTKVPDVVKPTNVKTLGTSVINSPMSPHSL